MRVGIYLVNYINPSTGGNFSYYDKFINAIDEYGFSQQLDICFVGRVPAKKNKLRKAYVQLPPLIFYKIFKALEKLKITGLISRVFGTNADLCSRADSRRLKKNKVDVLLFPKQFLKEVNNFPFISMNWDAGHKTTFAFPELLGDFDSRERWYQVEMQKALAIYVESQSSKEEFVHFYSVPEKKIEVVPLFAGGVIDLNVDVKAQETILGELQLSKLSYFYYPAQFWAHKNHYNLILAFKKLISTEGSGKLKLVFSGSDKGNKNYIASVIQEAGLSQHVVVLDFISNEKVYTLYKNAIALVMPTFLGPTNMPLLEAHALQTAVICSDMKGHRETSGDGALYADPGDSDAWYTAMTAVLSDDFRHTLIERADRIQNTSIFNIRSAIEQLEKNLIKLIPVRKTFS